MEPAEAVRSGDPDRYVATLFAPADRRAALLTLYAFDIEIASLRARVHEAMPGEIRLRWWADQIASRDRSGSPLADRLQELAEAYALPVEAFETYLEARISDLYDDAPGTRTDLEAYAGETDGLILQLACLVLDRDAADRAADACGHGACLRLASRLLADSHRLSRFAPEEMVSAGGGGRSDVETFRPAMEAFAQEHAGAFVRALPKVPDVLRPAFLHLAPDIASPGQRAGRLRCQWAMLRAATGRWPRPR